MTADALPLTEDEERELRETLAHEHDPLKTGRATSMAEAIQMQRNGYDAVTIYEGDVAKCHISNGGNARVCWEDVGPSLLATLDAERARRAPPHSRSDARRIAAQRGESAPVFDAAPSGPAGAVERKGRPHTFWATHRDAEPTGTPCSCSWGADHGDGKYEEEYPASVVVEAVRALEWYSDPDTWLWQRDSAGVNHEPEINRDRGRRAAAALASLPKDLRDAARAPR